MILFLFCGAYLMFHGHLWWALASFLLACDSAYDKGRAS